MDVEDEVVLYAVEDGVARVTLNRPDRLNASNGAMSRALTAAMTRAGQDPAVRVVLLSGAGRAFCAGADMKVLGELSGGSSTEKSGSGVLRYDGLMNFEKPVIAAVHGACVGVGLIMVSCADIRIACENAFFVAPFASLGLCAEGGMAWLLAQHMGKGNATEMLMTGRRVPAAEAHAKGLVASLLPEEGFHDAAFEYARAMARNSAPKALATIKSQIAHTGSQTYQESLEEALETVKGDLAAPDFKEAISARGEKRVPRFEPVVCGYFPPVGSN